MHGDRRRSGRTVRLPGPRDRRPAARLPGAIATWEYRFEEVDGATLVTETWTDDRRGWPDFLANAFDRAATRGHTFADFQRGNIRTTLQRLKAALEAPLDGDAPRA